MSYYTYVLQCDVLEVGLNRRDLVLCCAIYRGSHAHVSERLTLMDCYFITMVICSSQVSVVVWMAVKMSELSNTSKLLILFSSITVAKYY